MTTRATRFLRSLLDVEITSANDGDVLAYDAGTGKWENSVGGGNGGSQPLLNVRGTLLPGQITTLRSVGVELAPDPGPGKSYAPYLGSLTILGGNTPYADGGDLVIAPPSNPGSSLIRWGGSQDALQQIGGQVNWIGASAANSTDPLEDWENLPLTLTCRSGDFSSGNGIVYYSVFYELVSFA